MNATTRLLFATSKRSSACSSAGSIPMTGAEQTPLLELRDRCLKAKAKDIDATYRRIRRERYARVFKRA